MSCVSTRQMSWLSARHMSCVSTIRYAQCSEPTQRRRRIKRLLFDVFRDVSRETTLFETICGRRCVRSCLKTICFRWSCHEKNKKTLHRRVTRVTSAVKTAGKYTIWNSSPDPADPPDPDYPDYQVSESAAGTLPSTRAGGQDDGS